jgi:hypothetical protein
MTEIFCLEAISIIIAYPKIFDEIDIETSSASHHIEINSLVVP